MQPPPLPFSTLLCAFQDFGANQGGKPSSRNSAREDRGVYYTEAGGGSQRGAAIEKPVDGENRPLVAETDAAPILKNNITAWTRSHGPYDVGRRVASASSTAKEPPTTSWTSTSPSWP